MKASNLHIDLEVGEKVTINGDVVVRVEQKSGRKVRLRITAERDVPIKRS